MTHRRIAAMPAALGLAALAALSGCNSDPVALDDTVTAPAGQPVEIAVLANDTDPDGDPLVLEDVYGAEKGHVEITADNRVLYIPDTDAAGEDVFRYRVKDNKDDSSEAQVRVTLGPPAAGRLTAMPEERLIVVEERDAPVAEPERVVAAPAGSPLVEALSLALHTGEDEKNAEEPVSLTVERDGHILARQIVGVNEVWPSGSARVFDIDLDPDVPLEDIDEISVVIDKLSAPGRPTATWTVSSEMHAELADGGRLELVPRTRPVKMGDGAPTTSTIRIPATRR